MTVMLLEWVLTSIFLILVVLALRAALGKRVSARLRYALWAVVLVRLLVPVQLFTSPIAGTRVFSENRTEKVIYKVDEDLRFNGPEEDAIKSLGGQDGPSVALTTAPGVPPNAPTAPDAPEPPAAPDLTKAPAWLGWLWLAGSVAAALVLLASNLRFYWRLRRERIPLETADCPLRVYAAVDLPSPCLLGILRPAIYVTPDAAADPDMLRHVLAHEYTHYKHGDHIWSLLRCAALAVHWWDPLVWAAAVLSQRDAELACDEGALKRLGDGERAGYGNTLLALVTAKPRPGDLFRCATTMAGDKKSLKERVTRIAKAPQRVVWAVIVVVLVTALACVCAFGQAEPEADDPVSSADPAVSAQPSQESVTYDEHEWVMSYFVPDVTDVPEDVLTAVGAGVRESYKRFLDVRLGYFSWLSEDEMPQFDGWRVENLTGPYENDIRGVKVEIWRVNYEYHADDPVKAENLLVGGMYVTEDGWLCPTYSNCTYYIFLPDEQGSRYLAAVMMANDCAPDNGAAPERFQREVESALAMKLTGMPLQADLNHNGIPETLQVVEIDEGMGQRLDVWEGDELIFSDEGFHAHAGWIGYFLCALDSGEYLLRYTPTMYGGTCTYTYELFTLENGQETVVRGNSVEFDINFQPWIHQSFDPEAIAAFMDEVNDLLAHSIQLLNTDEELLPTFEREGRLYDSLWWLDMGLEVGEGPVYVRDNSKSMLENLRAYKEAMEQKTYANTPTVFPVDELGTDIRLDYRDKSVRFRCPGWDYRFQQAEHVEPKILDLNGDGRDEIVFILIGGHGTGCLVEYLFVFDAETLEQYDTSGLNRELLNSIQSTGDGENFYLSGPGLDVTIPKSEAQAYNEYADMAEYIDLSMGNYIVYTIEDGKIFCWVGCDASGFLVNYIGYVRFSLEFSSGRVSAGMDAPGFFPQNHFYYTAQYVKIEPDAPLF